VADKPDGKQRNERITFTRPAAERIAKVVRQVEGGDRDSSGLTFRRVPPQGDAGKIFRIATFTGAWATGDTKTVTLKFQASTPNTVVATNLFANLQPPDGDGNCAIAKEGTAWFLVESLHHTVTVITGATLTTAGLEFTRAVITVQATATASVQIVGTTSCAEPEPE
jgi:hypothetical protein